MPEAGEKALLGDPDTLDPEMVRNFEPRPINTRDIEEKAERLMDLAENALQGELHTTLERKFDLGYRDGIERPGPGEEGTHKVTADRCQPVISLIVSLECEDEAGAYGKGKRLRQLIVDFWIRKASELNGAQASASLNFVEEIEPEEQAKAEGADHNSA